ncbi:hypothetical protein [Bacillus sp. AFS017336]|uniref:hypothetical protein n=1 Tax=Bacillus sp. AFS017336 TaxID=2033489 RepID=UPI000BF014FE|nr:hypothetical protein [Bacillus sp. AFS017336]PEL07795.1 hypothetical protein CN601_19075 [Bacillus sp. AFS017336]
MLSKQKERAIEELLRYYVSFKKSICELENELKYLHLPTLVPKYDKYSNQHYIPNDTEYCSIENIESPRVKILERRIEKLKLIVNCIERSITALQEPEKRFLELRYFQEKPLHIVLEELHYSPTSRYVAYRIRQKILNSFSISLNNLL